MRAGPIGLLPDLTEILRRAEIQARLTHDTPDGIESAQAAALAVHYCHHRIGPTAQLPAWVHDQLRAAGGRVDWTNHQLVSQGHGCWSQRVGSDAALLKWSAGPRGGVAVDTCGPVGNGQCAGQSGRRGGSYIEKCADGCAGDVDVAGEGCVA
jgi:hypothetical protein